MTGFTPRQLRALRRNLDGKRVHSREIAGQSIHYIEGWFAVAEANAIFGFAGWDREIVHFERVFERSRGDGTSCAYVARVRIKVRADDITIAREGTGWGYALGRTPAEAHERASKTAETDATKRALATFGKRFGLGLYDREQPSPTAPAKALAMTLYEPGGALFADGLSCESYCSGFRQLIEAASGSDLTSLVRENRAELNRLKKVAPALRTAEGVHYADILHRLIAAKMDQCTEPDFSAVDMNPAAQTGGNQAR